MLAWKSSFAVLAILTGVCQGACDTAVHHVGGELDVDGDGHGVDHDCDDRDADVHPAAAEVPYDGIDQDCDGADLVDVDGDGIASDRVGGHDCDDHDATVHPGAAEVCDHRDNDCDGRRDEGFTDVDEDSFADCVDPTPLGFDGGAGREAPLSVQLHLHGSLSECTGTMLHHTREAERVGVDVLWWSDHSSMIAMAARTGGFDFDGGELLQTREILYREITHGFSVVECDVLSPASAVLPHADGGGFYWRVGGTGGDTPWSSFTHLYGVDAAGGEGTRRPGPGTTCR